MEFSWTILLAVYAANWVYIGLVFFAQVLDKSLPARHSEIPGSKQQKFLYGEDFHTMTWGDAIAVPLFESAFVHLAVNGLVSMAGWLAFILIATADALGFMFLCLRKVHKPDMGFPSAGKISVTGIIHLPYHGVGMAMGLFCLWHWLVLGSFSAPVLCSALIGGVMYAASVVADVWAGNFKPVVLADQASEVREQQNHVCRSIFF